MVRAYSLMTLSACLTALSAGEQQREEGRNEARKQPKKIYSEAEMLAEDGEDYWQEAV